ncbi:hypothetical protein [Flavobacterium sedimenticola]|uniref:DoxX family protein n=1 Tax=Flavobacterium sedimenticola TaxID=3043286 RepID=A0ABT6XQG4_9FLAO|nr:hypothetical protein [Flavobacterium sedimenticola]MDI9257338.1 hypothetical protein [Flavobacterium sedimenticola]
MTSFKKVILGLFLSSFIGYLEWAKQSEFIVQIEFDLLRKINQSPEAFLHPFILIPLLGQLILVFSLLIAKPKMSWVFIASTAIALLFLMLLLVGVLSWNPKMMLFTLPFLGCYSYLLLQRKKIQLSA